MFCRMMSVYHIHVWHLWRSEEGIGVPEIGFTDGWGAPCGFWEQSQDFCKRNKYLNHEPDLALVIDYGGWMRMVD